MTVALTGALHLAPEAQDLLFRQARTANTFTSEPVTDDQLRAIYDLVKYAPTALNQQPLRITVIRGDAARARLLPLLAEFNRAKSATAPVIALLAADLHFHEELPRLVPYRSDAKDLFADPTHRENSALFNATLQIGYFLLGIRAAGLAAGPMGGFDHDGVDREFFPDGRHRTLLVVNIGRPGPNAWLQRLPRLDYDDVVTAI